MQFSLKLAQLWKFYFYFQTFHYWVLIAQLCNYQIENVKFHAIVTHISAVMKFLFLFAKFLLLGANSAIMQLSNWKCQSCITFKLKIGINWNLGNTWRLLFCSYLLINVIKECLRITEYSQLLFNMLNHEVITSCLNPFLTCFL